MRCGRVGTAQEAGKASTREKRSPNDADDAPRNQTITAPLARRKQGRPQRGRKGAPMMLMMLRDIKRSPHHLCDHLIFWRS